DRFAGDRLIVENTIVELVDLFFVRRNQSMETLVNFGLEKHHLEWKGIHPSLGEVTLQWLLNTWVEHDLSHLNQINRVISTKFSDVGPWKEYLRILKE
ncbi:MAG: DinB family protein, partial [Candidatus Kariarchaeaceae archaeon]